MGEQPNQDVISLSECSNAMTTAANGPGNGVRLVQVDPDRAGQRIDNFLTTQLKGAPRSLIYRLLRTGQVRINGKRPSLNRAWKAATSTHSTGASGSAR